MIMLFGVFIGIIYGIGQAFDKEDGNISVTGIIFLDIIIMLVFSMGGEYGVVIGVLLCIFSDIIIVNSLQESYSNIIKQQKEQENYENYYGIITYDNIK